MCFTCCLRIAPNIRKLKSMHQSAKLATCTTVGRKGENWLLYDDERVEKAHGGARDYEQSVYILD